MENTPLILDLRDRMARIETKLDGHLEAHTIIDKRLDKLEIQAEESSSAIAAFKVRWATFSALGGAVISIIAMLGDRFWNLLS
jgi:hypothetical protein